MTRRAIGLVTMAFLVPLVIIATGCSDQSRKDSADQDSPPNLLLIVADDMGYSDLSMFGGEISTPNLDALAESGMTFTNFYVGPTCSPTRSMLLSGTDNHIAGLGNMAEAVAPNQLGQPGYEGYLNDQIAPLPALLRESGFHTYMAGKWHLGEEPEHWPSARGFEKTLSLIDGGGSHWDDGLPLLPTKPSVTITRNGELLDSPPEGYYSTKDFTNFLMESIGANREDGKPFFAYLAYQAPHSPLALPDDWLDRYAGRYDQGYDATRTSRLERQKELGITPVDATGFPRLANIPPWEELSDEEKRRSARKMELYAGMVENMDFHIGRLFEFLKEIDEYDNTLIVFFSDNGAASEDVEELIATLMGDSAKEWFDATYDNSFENWGRQGSFVEYGPAWAQVGSVPLRLFKGTLADGGVRLPLIVSGPGVAGTGDLSDTLLHVMDIAPTFLELAGATYPSTYNGHPVEPIQGKSWVSMLAGERDAVRGSDDWFGMEIFGQRAVRKGDWKLLHLPPWYGGSGDWELFNLVEDPAELNNLASQNPEKLEELLAHWEQYVQENNVILPEGRSQPGDPTVSSNTELVLPLG